ncbi:sulfatase-like hydrolase/transferase [Anaerolineales bacterium HSG6]|nr:sulfatase-like hydrolase/transferase [Anaerolineales bacterium HSG6]
MFYSFGHIYNATQNYFYFVLAPPIILEPIYVLFIVWSILFVILFYFILTSHRNLLPLTRVLNVVTGILVLFQFFNIGAHWLQTEEVASTDIGIMQQKDDSTNRPDIYHIILDGYGRSDILADIYQHDNQPFIEALQERGFYVAKNSQSNYAQTVLSLASILNLDYIDNLDLSSEEDQTIALRKRLKNNKVVDFLHQHGYLFVSFSTGYSLTEMDNADIFIIPQLGLSEFENMLVSTTPIPVLLTIISSNISQYDFHRARFLEIFKQLGNPIKANQPIYLFAHILLPHPPFVFDAEGNPVNPKRPFSLDDGDHFRDKGGNQAEYIEGYRNQLAFTNQQLLIVLDKILANTDQPPIIILQGDHGPGSQLDLDNINQTNLTERFYILNAYHLPDGGSSKLSDTITPVNSYRLIFNHYFSTNYEELPNKNYFSTWANPTKFIDVTEQVSE